jgi:PKHD-type hydroxylase
MLHKHKYWWFKKAIPERICDLIIARGKDFIPEKAVTGVGKDLQEDTEENPSKIRRSNIRWLTDNWIYKEIFPYINEANKNAEWNYDWVNSEAVQFTEYGPNQFYDWHQDSFPEPYDGKERGLPEWYGLIRKLSVTVTLSHPHEYEGGLLQFDLSNKETGENITDCKEILEKGSLVVFPSWLWHRVTPVTKGIRYSAVIWTLGKPFK